MFKSLELLSVFPRRPVEFWDRLLAIVQVQTDRILRKRPSYKTIEWDRAIQELGRAIGKELRTYLEESPLQEIERQVLEGIAKLPQNAPFRRTHNGDLALARLAYILCRALKPTTAIETGTCYGVSSSFILKALQVNSQGTLHSIDLPPLAESGDKFVGILIPEELKLSWKLYRGASRRVLPDVLRSLEAIDFFLHDSLHTYKNILKECELVYPYLNRRAAVVVDDIQDHSAFEEWLTRSHPDSRNMTRMLCSV